LFKIKVAWLRFELSILELGGKIVNVTHCILVRAILFATLNLVSSPVAFQKLLPRFGLDRWELEGTKEQLREREDHLLFQNNPCATDFYNDTFLYYKIPF